ncbi:hypothetical protein BJ912DRAFT_521442 [Pholiota molesta]|nr:hypothetical protein BJ912DRAFT_521442 [Pholiota molesta]
MGKKSSKQAMGSGAAGQLSSHDPRSPAPVKDVQSVKTADTNTLNDQEEQARTTTSTATVRPKLTISPSAAPRDDVAANKSGSDSGSSLSISSPVFAHSPDSEESYDEDDLRYGYVKARQGYRYGGYNPANAKSPPKRIPGASVLEDGNKSESSMGYYAATKPAREAESSRVHQGNEKPREQTKAHHHQAKGKQKAKVDDRGEWLVLDMGSEQAFNSILRIFHRQFSTPLESGFLHPSITATMSLQSSVNPNEVRSMPNSPVLRTFWSASTLAHGSGNGSTVNEDGSTLGPALSRNDQRRGSDADDDFDDIYEAGPSSQQPLPKLAYPHNLASLSSKPSYPNPRMAAPALPYPEWRTEVVHRARRYGMREAGRPMELAMYGWGRDVVDLETSAVYAKMRKKEEANRQRLRQSISLLNESGKSPSTLPAWEGSTSDQDTEGDGANDEVEAEAGFDGKSRTEKDWDKVDSKRRMSTVSHVSTIKAKQDGSKAKTTTTQTTDDDTLQDDSDGGTEKGTDDSDSDAIGKFGDDEFEGGYAYGLDDEEEALAEGLGSIMNDSEEESEVEWFAWTTDLPRQLLVRQQQAELDRIKEEKLREERDFFEFESQPLSPMEFSNPFPGDTSSFISQNIGLPTVLPPIPPPKTPEEERRQYAETRRKLEPSAVSMSALPPMPSLPMSPRLSAANHPPPSSSLQSNQHTRIQATIWLKEDIMYNASQIIQLRFLLPRLRNLSDLLDKVAPFQVPRLSMLVLLIH